MTHQPIGPRCLLWVDAVGGFLVCLGDEVTLGQAVPGNGVEIPILGDVSRRHAVIRRQGERYAIQPIGPLTIDARAVREPKLLHDGDELVLGNSVRLRFRKPHALSSTARIDYLSHHRTHPSSDGVLLMAESCVLGPDLSHHVVCRRWSGQVVLSRAGTGDFRFRAPESVEVDGQASSETGTLRGNSRLVGTDFAISLEEM